MSKIIKVVTHAPHLAVPLEQPQSVVPVMVMEQASPLTKAGRLLRAMHNWKKAGMPRASKELRRRRLGPQGCAGCPYWKPEGNFGFGECRAPGCGCSQFKAWLLNETCPHPDGSRWPVMQPPLAPPAV